MDNLDILGVLIIKLTEEDGYNVLVFHLVSRGNKPMWSYRHSRYSVYDKFNVENIREAYVYAIELSKKINLPFVGYRNSRVDASQGKGYICYSMEFLKWFSSIESAT